MSKLCLSRQQSFVEARRHFKEIIMNHKTTPTQLVSNSHFVSAAITKALALSLRSQKITSKTLKVALLSTKTKTYSEQGNFFAETIMVGADQFICIGKVIAGDEFLDSFTIENFSGLALLLKKSLIADLKF